MATCAPSRAKARAIAAPRPRPAPVTSTVRSEMLRVMGLVPCECVDMMGRAVALPDRQRVGIGGGPGDIGLCPCRRVPEAQPTSQLRCQRRGQGAARAMRLARLMTPARQPDQP